MAANEVKLIKETATPGRFSEDLSGASLPPAIPAGSVAYLNANPTPAPVGGVPGGYIFSPAHSLTQVLDLLFYPYQHPAFLTFTSSLFGDKEVGQDLPTGLATINYTISNSANFLSAQPNGIQSTTLANTTFPVASPLNLTGSGSFQVNITGATALLTPGSRNISLQGTDTSSATFTGVGNINWKWRVYYGPEGNATLNSAQIVALPSSLLATTGAGTYVFTAGTPNYKYICYPSTFTTLTSFIIARNRVGFFTSSKIEFDNFEIPVGRKYKRAIESYLQSVNTKMQ